MLDRIGHVVRAARERAALTRDALAAQAGVPTGVIEELENGRSGMTTTQLDRVARVLALVPSALLRGRDEVRQSPSVFLRHAGAMDFHDEDLPKLDFALEQGRLLRAFAALVGETSPILGSKLLTPRAARGDRAEAAATEGYALARTVRRELDLPAAPIGDVCELIEQRFEIAVVVVALASTRVTALSVREPNAGAIVLNDTDPERAANPLVARVHLPHELCHLLFDPSDGGVHVVVDVVSDRRDLRAEQRARAFAAELLLPLEGVTELLGAPRATPDSGTAEALVSRARGHFQTPYEITVNHLANLGFIAADLREWLVAGERPTGPRVVQATALPRSGAPSQLLSVRVQRAHERGLITDGEARNALGIDALAPLPWDR